MPSFSCTDCESPEIRLPRELGEEAKVYCGGCGKQLGTWNDYRSLIGKLVGAQAAGTPSCDPVN